jgi:hypothetical protein
MGLCDGDWKSEINFDKKSATEPAGYASDGVLHICPSVNTEFRGQQTVAVSPQTPTSLKPYYFENGSCVPDGEGDRFTIKYTRKAPNSEETYHYDGSGRVLNNGKGPAFIYGRVTVTTEGGPAEGVRSGAWEAVRIGDHRGPGPGEDGKVETHDGHGGGEEAKIETHDG